MGSLSCIIHASTLEIRVPHPENNRCFPRRSLRLENAYYPWTGHRWTTAIDRRLELHPQVDRLSHLSTTVPVRGHHIQSNWAVARRRRRSLNSATHLCVFPFTRSDREGVGRGRTKAPQRRGANEWRARGMKGDIIPEHETSSIRGALCSSRDAC